MQLQLTAQKRNIFSVEEEKDGKNKTRIISFWLFNHFKSYFRKFCFFFLSLTHSLYPLFAQNAPHSLPTMIEWNAYNTNLLIFLYKRIYFSYFTPHKSPWTILNRENWQRINRRHFVYNAFAALLLINFIGWALMHVKARNMIINVNLRWVSKRNV